MEFLVDSFFLVHHPEHSSAFWPPLFLMRSQLFIMLFSLYMVHILLAAFKFFSFSFSSLSIMCLDVDLFVFTLFWVLLNLLDMEIGGFVFWDVWGYYFLKYFLSLFYQYTYVNKLDVVSQVSESLFIFLWSFFLCYSNWLISFGLLSNCWFFFVPAQKKNLSSEFFISFIVLFNSKISIWFSFL